MSLKDQSCFSEVEGVGGKEERKSLNKIISAFVLTYSKLVFLNIPLLPQQLPHTAKLCMLHPAKENAKLFILNVDQTYRQLPKEFVSPFHH